MWNYNFYTYIAASPNNKVLYIGVTKDLKRRMYEHKNKLVPGFTAKYNINKLVYYEHYMHINEAIKREKNLKKWKREWKNKLISKINPEWRDLYEEV